MFPTLWDPLGSGSILCVPSPLGSSGGILCVPSVALEFPELHFLGAVQAFPWLSQPFLCAEDSQSAAAAGVELALEQRLSGNSSLE